MRSTRCSVMANGKHRDRAADLLGLMACQKNCVTAVVKKRTGVPVEPEVCPSPTGPCPGGSEELRSSCKAPCNSWRASKGKRASVCSVRTDATWGDC